MSGVEIERKGRTIEFSAPSTDDSVRRWDDGRDWLNVTSIGEELGFSILDTGAGGEYARSWCHMLLDREAALRLREFIDEWLDTHVSSD